MSVALTGDQGRFLSSL